MKRTIIDKLVNKILEESLHEKADELVGKIKTKMDEWTPNAPVPISGQPSDMHEDEDLDPMGLVDRFCDEENPDDYDAERCAYHKKTFGKGEMQEKLIGKQKNLDKNKNNKLDAEDFAMLRKGKSKKETKESKQLCKECGMGYMQEGMCSECGYGGMNEENEFDFLIDEIANQETTEGNKFTGELAKAKKRGDDSFEVDGKTYEVTEEEKWIQKTKMKKGALHKQMGVPEGEKLSKSELEKTKSKLMKKAEGDKKLSKEDSKMLKRANLALTLGKLKENKNNKLRLTESELIDLIESLVLEEKKAKGMAETEKVLKQSKKENEDYIKSVTKKMKEYLKNGSKGEYNMEPTIFPKGNGELAKMDKMAYTPDGATQEYVDNFTAAGQENLVYDEIHPNEEWMDANIEGSSKTGNNNKWANAVDTGVNKKRNKIRKDNLLGAVKQMAYNKAPQPVIDDLKQGSLAKFDRNFGKGAGKKATKILNQLESVEGESEKLINEEFNKMKHLIGYNKKTQ